VGWRLCGVSGRIGVVVTVERIEESELMLVEGFR
jgi:hypothetical protein